jgi:hypothetical protein
MNLRRHLLNFLLISSILLVSLNCQRVDSYSPIAASTLEVDYQDLTNLFLDPPNSARPGVYWYFMDGNLSREEMTADLESMKEVGIGHVLFLEVNVGVPQGPVKFLSEEWQESFTHAVKECERLGIVLTLGSGPGWTGSGGPWVKMEESMQHLVASKLEVAGPLSLNQKLEVPKGRNPFLDWEDLHLSLENAGKTITRRWPSLHFLQQTTRGQLLTQTRKPSTIAPLSVLRKE